MVVGAKIFNVYALMEGLIVTYMGDKLRHQLVKLSYVLLIRPSISIIVTTKLGLLVAATVGVLSFTSVRANCTVWYGPIEQIFKDILSRG